MKPELRERWAEALESGKYKQGPDYLCKDGHYCCLGVLLDITDRLDKYGDGAAYLKFTDVRELGLRDGTGESSNCELKPLSVLNDGNSVESVKSFKEIAKIIRTDDSYFHDWDK